MRIPVWLLTLAILPAAGAVQYSLAADVFPPPPPTRVEMVVDTIFGTLVPDPYRWLENGDSPSVQAWTTAQNQYYKKYVDDYEGKQTLAAEFTKLMETGTIAEPFVRGNRYFAQRRAGNQNHKVIYVREGLAGKDEVLLDPNEFSEDGTAALDWMFLSNDGALVAYGVSQAGTEWSTLFIKDVISKGMLLDTIPFTRGAAVAWLPDNSGFYYTRYPAPGSVPKGEENYSRKVFFHKLGASWEQDPLVWENTADKTTWCAVDISPNGRWLLVSDQAGWTKSELYLKDLNDTASQFVRLTEGRDAIYQAIVLNDRLIVSTNDGAPRMRTMSVSYDTPDLANWQEIIPEREVTYNTVAVIANNIIIEGLRNAHSVLEVFSLTGRPVQDIALPTLGTVSGISGEWNGHELFYFFNSFTYSPTVFRYDFITSQSEVFEAVPLPFDLSNLEVKQVLYNSKDGTPVSMFIVAPKGTKLDGQNPCVLDGYGGFDAMDTPVFNRRKILWMLHGGIYALANLRGNGEYGEAWHRAGMLDKKQNTFDDFIAAAEYLFKEGYTNPAKLSLYGGSNGGLLIGAVITQRPDICAAAVCDVPLLDMIRYQKFNIARLWIPEYGSSEDSSQFQYLIKYSPYQNVKKGVAYPAVLFKAGDSDSRVNALHARKMAALMQASTSSGRPILLRVEGKAGHGQGKPVSKVTEEVVEEWCFVYKALGLRLST